MSRTEGGGKINSKLRTRCDHPASVIHILSSMPWTSTAQWPGPWPTGFSLRSWRLFDISVIYKETAFGLFFQELLLLAFLWGENFSFSEGSQRGFVVLQCYLGFWCKSHLKLEAASSYSISCRAGLCIHEGEMWWGFWWIVHPVSTYIQCHSLPSPRLSSASAFQSALALSGCE